MRKVTGKLNNDFGEITSLTVPYDLVVSGSNHYVYLVMDEEVGVLKKLYKFDKKGKKWENVAEYVLNSVEGWKITGKRIRAGAQEIDLSVANISLDDELWQMGAYILIECKNWKKHVGIQQIRNIAHISSMKGNKTAILFTANGITSDSQEEIQRLAMTNIYIICITAVELKQLQSAVECKKLILDKWKSLQDSIEVSGII